MAPFWDWEIPLILALQEGHPTWTLLFRAITFLGSEIFALILGPLFYWCLSREIGTGMVIAIISSQIVNFGLKDLFHSPRPYQYDNRILNLNNTPGYGLPSGHAQNSTVVWLYLASKSRRAWGWVVAVFLIAAISFSRLYLGVHFPVDVIGGIITGLFFLGLFLTFEMPIVQAVKQLSLPLQIGGITFLGLVLVILHPTSDFSTMASLLTFGCIGLFIERHTINFKVAGPWRARIARYLIGIAGMLLIWGGLRVLFAPLSHEGLPLATALRALRYGITGLWITLGAPWTFLKLHLIESQQKQSWEAAHIEERQ